VLRLIIVVDAPLVQLRIILLWSSTSFEKTVGGLEERLVVPFIVALLTLKTLKLG